jgi:hypothetical protein
VLLTRITWALVIVGFGLLIGGFVADDANVLLILAIAAELGAIILVLASWARSAKEAADAHDDDLTFVPAGSVSDDTEGDDLDSTFADVPAVRSSGSRGPARRPAARAKPKSSARKPAARKSTARNPSGKPKAPAARAKPKAAARKPSARKSTAKAKPKAAPKPKPAARKPTTKRKPPRRKP